MVKKLLFSGFLLALFAAVGTTAVSFVHGNALPRIEAAQKTQLLGTLHQFVPPETHDNDMFTDTLEVHDRELLGSSEAITVYRARKGGTPVAVVLTAVAPDGYSGDIKLLIGINYDGSIAGVRVISHKETPGLGDRIEAERSPWINGFAGRSLQNPAEEQWKVKKDGGQFDQFTGATITPRAVVKAVANTLRYYQMHRDALFAPAAEKPHE
ncbi:MAG TPA: electron transport complex subunit RsxG [Gammaproteobacteria bacterium]